MGTSTKVALWLLLFLIAAGVELMQSSHDTKMVRLDRLLSEPPRIEMSQRRIGSMNYGETGWTHPRALKEQKGRLVLESVIFIDRFYPVMEYSSEQFPMRVTCQYDPNAYGNRRYIAEGLQHKKYWRTDSNDDDFTEARPFFDEAHVEIR